MVQINRNRLWDNLTTLATIGALPGGGVCRLAFSEEDKKGRDFVEHLMRSLGLDVYIDAVGNMLGIRRGRTERIVLTGSHTDTVGTGGKFDGSLGVLAGLEVIQTLNEHKVQTEHAIGVISFVNEEGVRFMPDMMGSLFLTGQLELDTLRAIKGTDGKTIGECLDALDYAGADTLPAHQIHRFIELHIEQGPVLLENQAEIGVVDRVQGILWEEITFKGESNHAGVTPMHRRRDAGYVASAIATYVRELTTQIEGLRATAGSLTLSPNLINVIAEKAVLTIDLRHAEATHLLSARALLFRKLEALCAEEGITYENRNLADVMPVRFNAGCVRCVEEAVEKMGYVAVNMISGAGHDAQIMASTWPASMIFVPSQGAISHNINEYTTPEHVEAGANVLLHAILSLAGS